MIQNLAMIPVLRSLLWLLVSHSFNFKMLLLVHHRPHRSPGSELLTVLSVKTDHGEAAFTLHASQMCFFLNHFSIYMHLFDYLLFFELFLSCPYTCVICKVLWVAFEHEK